MKHILFIKLHKYFFIIVFVLSVTTSFSQSYRAGIDLFAGFSHPAALDSFTFVHANGEKYKVMPESKGSGTNLGLGVNLKLGYQRHFLILQPEIRFYDQMYLINLDSINLWTVSDSVKFGVTKTNLSFKVLYDYKFKIKSQTFSWSAGFNYILPPIVVKEKSVRRGNENIHETQVKYNGLPYKIPDVFDERTHIYAILGFNYDMSPNITFGGFFHQRLTGFTKNNTWFFYGIHMNYTLPLNKDKKHIYIHESIK